MDIVWFVFFSLMALRHGRNALRNLPTDGGESLLIGVTAYALFMFSAGLSAWAAVHFARNAGLF